MDLPDIVKQIVDYIPSVNFTQPETADSVSLFETTIRYLGGMLAGYDLLKGPLANVAEEGNVRTLSSAIDPANIDALLTQSKNLADALKFAFNTSTGIPANGLFPQNQTTDGGTSNGLATIGTLVLEWTHLSDLLGDEEYGQLAQKGESYLLNPQPASSEPFPGLVGTDVDITTGQFLDANGGWSGGDDSFYEYLIKMFVYDASRFSSYKDRWTLAADSSIKYLASHPSSRPELTFLAEFRGTQPINSSQHLTCFDGGNFLLGGAVLGEQQYIDFGLQLVDGCHDTYNQTATRIGPESFSWNTTNLPADQSDFYDKAGYYITDSSYILRPEVIESYYYAYRITGDSKYQDWAWDAFVAINATTKARSGYTEITNVNAAGGGDQNDFQDSFLFAEVLKYSYLIHAPDAVYDVQAPGQTNMWVFNTEAHPMKVVGSTS
ncbi:MAG: hypothetical protein Q9160_003161 [Pyrenula sp. 1 TL-2023]